MKKKKKRWGISETLVFCTNFGGKLSFILSFLFPKRLYCGSILEPCALNSEFQHFILRFNQKIAFRAWTYIFFFTAPTCTTTTIITLEPYKHTWPWAMHLCCAPKMGMIEVKKMGTI
jgi:hypothetical protein